MDPLIFYKCLADDTRLKSLLLIAREKELCVCELTEALQVSQPKVSRHLAQLRECGLLEDRREGQWIFYSLSPSLPNWARAVIQTTAEHNPVYFHSAHQLICTMGDRPERKQQCC
ncbi:metalloregulator ArsR/SmtB family transcription factor [Oceanicoccus sagamiensis]|uniref:Transcriptional regulator n=1 Tax=Oceanicoccus sagamiensis TaxID=716816 RepID=A0A1X9N7S2_9GAMM|nr:metalloregulator ArsR/SmtB family transcription factor [Oceanicoccus sagamiensis]ARN74118.1 transcriptional regulator [Oceanicoccus sagamiensis]